MKVTISLLHLEHTESIDERIHEKSEKLAKYFNGHTDCKWTCWVKEGNHYAEIDISGPTFRYHAKADSDSLYKTLDKVVHKMDRQLSKKRDKQKSKIHRRKGSKTGELVILDIEQAWTDLDDDLDDAA